MGRFALVSGLHRYRSESERATNLPLSPLHVFQVDGYVSRHTSLLRLCYHRLFGIVRSRGRRLLKHNMWVQLAV